MFASWSVAERPFTVTGSLEEMQRITVFGDEVMATSHAAVWVTTTDGTSPTRISAFDTGDNLDALNLAVSADGTVLIVEQEDGDNNSTLWLSTRSDVTTPSWELPRLLDIPQVGAGRMRPSPLAEVSGEHRLVVSDGGQLRELASDDLVAWTQLSTIGFGGTEDDRDPYLSPDGCWLLFSSNRDATNDLWLSVRSESGNFKNPTRLDTLATGTNDFSPALNPMRPTELWFLRGPGASGQTVVTATAP